MLFVMCAIPIAILWAISIGFYALGWWPLGVALRVLVWIIGLWGVWWIGKHLLIGEEQMTMNDFEKWERKKDGTDNPP